MHLSFAKPESLSLFTGKIGTLTLQNIFNTFGYSSFYIGINFLWLGSFLLQKIHSPEDFKKYYTKIFTFLIAQVFILILAASLLSIFQAWFKFQSHETMLFGAGGLFGLRVGGTLYSLFGAYGSLSIISISALVISILTGLINIADIFFAIGSAIKNTAKYIFVYTFKVIRFSLGLFLNIFDNNIFVQKLLYKANKFIPQNNKKIKSIDISTENTENEIALDAGEITCPMPPKDLISYYPEEDMEIELHGAERTTTAKKKRTRKKKVSEETPNKLDAKATKIKNETIEDAKPNEFAVDIKSWKKKYTKPDLQLLDKPTKAIKMTDKQTKEQSDLLTTHLESFQIFGEVVGVHQGPTLTMYEYQLKAGVKLSKVASLNDDLAMALGASSIRILAPIPGKTTIGIEIPNLVKRVVNLSELMLAIKKEKNTILPIPMGMNVNNETIISDLTKMPHMLVSGTTGSGKSVFINTLISSLIFNKSPKELRFIMVDPKMIELSPYNGIPHLLKPVVTDVNEAKHILQWTEKEMDRRYQLLSKIGSKDIVSFNEAIASGKKKKANQDFEWAPLPYLVVIIDELADLMMTQGKDVEIPITRIAQKARACGIHMVIATQRPSSDIITGLIKTNFPTRVACKVSSGIDSRTILDTSGAEKLFGLGDLLFLPNGKSIQRLQSAYISEGEVKKLVNQAKKNN